MKEPGLLHDLFMLMIKIIAIVFAAMMAFTFMFGMVRNTDASMKQAFRDGDLIVFYRLDKMYKASDVIVIERSNELQVRRVIAISGDVVDIGKNGLLINGAIHPEPDICENTERFVDGISFPVTVGEGQVFVLGDAREHSCDSRMYGCVDVRDTHGTVIAVLRRRSI